MRRYELMLLFRPDLEDDKLQSAVEKVTRAIVNAGGALTKVSPWGKRRMAYEIQHFREASYFLLHFDIAPTAIRDIERGLLISEEVLRHLVTVLEDRGAAADDEELAPAAVPAETVPGEAALAGAASGEGLSAEGVSADDVTEAVELDAPEPAAAAGDEPPDADSADGDQEAGEEDRDEGETEEAEAARA